MSELLLPERQFSEAKSGLSEVMNEVVHDHRPQVIRRNTKDRMLLVRPDDARRWLDTFRLELHVTLDPGQIAILAEPLGLLAVGASFDDALDALVHEIQVYASRFFGRPQFYLHTSAARHEPYLLRFALTPPDEHRALLEADIEVAVPRVNEAVRSAM
jgi:PHD/YefM family antitoxin component YafN of YafNO toxin-antitoxin module